MIIINILYNTNDFLPPVYKFNNILHKTTLVYYIVPCRDLYLR